MEHFLSVLVAYLTGATLVEMYGPWAFYHLLVWIWDKFYGLGWWVLSGAWWILINILLPLIWISAGISLIYLTNRGWQGKMRAWAWEKDHTTKLRRVGE
jgi:hypothetical protein